MPRSTDKASPRRRDAEENRARLVTAAREMFATRGFDVPLGAIAQRAGVGRATLYRNFPDRFALAAAIFEDNLSTLEQLAHRPMDPSDAFMILLEAMIEQQVQTHALIPAMMAGANAPVLQAVERRVRRMISEPLRAAQASGTLRDDLTLTDVLAMLAMITGVLVNDASVPSRRRHAKRALELLVHGLVPRASDCG